MCHILGLSAPELGIIKQAADTAEIWAELGGVGMSLLRCALPGAWELIGRPHAHSDADPGARAPPPTLPLSVVSVTVSPADVQGS